MAAPARSKRNHQHSSRLCFIDPAVTWTLQPSARHSGHMVWVRKVFGILFTPLRELLRVLLRLRVDVGALRGGRGGAERVTIDHVVVVLHTA